MQAMNADKWSKLVCLEDDFIPLKEKKRKEKKRKEKKRKEKGVAQFQVLLDSKPLIRLPNFNAKKVTLYLFTGSQP